MVAAAMVAGGAIALSYYTLKRLLSATKTPLRLSRSASRVSPHGTLFPPPLRISAIVTAVSSLSYSVPRHDSGLFASRHSRRNDHALYHTAWRTLSGAIHSSLVDEDGLFHRWLCIGGRCAAALLLVLCHILALHRDGSVLANGAYGAIFGALTQWATGEELDTSMDGIGNHLHRSPHWWTHAVGDILAGVFNCFLLALLPPEASTAYLGWLGLR